MKQFMKHKTIILSTFVFLLVGINLTACKKMEDYKTKKIEYDATPSAPDGYESEILYGSSVGGAIIPYLPVNNTWGGGAAAWAVGEDEHIAPDMIYIRYYSLVDDKFYVAQHPLDQEEMYRLLTAKYKNRTGEVLTYTTFEISVAPCGLVGVWIAGDAGQLEICQFRAEEAELDFPKEYKLVSGIEVSREEILQYRKNLYSFIQKEIAEKRVSSEYWERLSKKYKWKLTFTDPGFEVYDYSVDLINIESRREASSGNWLTELNEKAILKELFFHIKHDKDPVKYQVQLYVVKPWDQDNPNDLEQVLAEMKRNRELMQIFDQFYKEAGNEDVSLQVEFDDSMKSAKLKLKTATKEQEITGCNVYGIFDSDHYDIDR
jgi:hypothetical protein